MINGKKVLAYIPARSGSKSIKDKNIIDVCGQPLIAYTIIAAKNSQYVDKVVVSTDSSHYAEIARRYGAEAPFLRPVEIAGDSSLEIDACLHLMNWFEERADKFDIIIKLQPTSPLRKTEDIDRALELMRNKQATSIISVSECLIPPQWTNTLPEDKSMNHFLREEFKSKNRQELPISYHLNGAIFIGEWEFVKQNRSWYGKRAFAYVLPKERSIDIDEPIDLKFAAVLLEESKEVGV